MIWMIKTNFKRTQSLSQVTFFNFIFSSCLDSNLRFYNKMGKRILFLFLGKVRWDVLIKFRKVILGTLISVKISEEVDTKNIALVGDMLIQNQISSKEQ